MFGHNKIDNFELSVNFPLISNERWLISDISLGVFCFFFYDELLTVDVAQELEDVVAAELHADVKCRVSLESKLIFMLHLNIRKIAMKPKRIEIMHHFWLTSEIFMLVIATRYEVSEEFQNFLNPFELLLHSCEVEFVVLILKFSRWQLLEFQIFFGVARQHDWHCVTSNDPEKKKYQNKRPKNYFKVS